MLELVLPYPPSKNTIDIQAKMVNKKTGRHFIGRRQSDEYLQFKRDVAILVRQQRAMDWKRPLLCDLSVDIDVYPPDNRRRDLFNVLESLSDALTLAGVWRDDSQIKEATGIRWREPVKHGKTVIRITEINTLFASVA